MEELKVELQKNPNLVTIVDDVSQLNRFNHINCPIVIIRLFKAGRTALHWSCSGGHLDIVRFLVTEMKSDIHNKDGVSL